MLLRYQVSRSTALHAQEAFVRVGLVVGAADRLVVLRAYSGATFEGESSQAPLNWHNENVFAAILLSHVTFRLVQFVITATDVAGLLTVQCITVDIAELRLRTVLK